MTTDAAGASIPQEIASKFACGAVRLQSATATLYEATDPASGDAAVLKVLRSDAIPSVPERQRVRRELTKLTSVRHDSLAPVIAAPEGGESLWYLRRWIEGENLRERIKRTGPIAPGEAAHIASRIAGALGELHRQGVLHRDLRAGHVILGPGDTVFLLDPAVGRMFKGPDGRHIVGTPGSVAPEAISGKLVSFRSDLYGLGVVLYEMLTGTPPFDPDDPEALKKQSETDPAPLPDGVPVAFGRLVTSLLSRDARERPFSAQQLERQLEPLVDLADPRRSIAPPAAPASASSPSPSVPPPVPANARSSMPPPVPAAAKRPPAVPAADAPTGAPVASDDAQTIMGLTAPALDAAPPSMPEAPTAEAQPTHAQPPAYSPTPPPQPVFVQPPAPQPPAAPEGPPLPSGVPATGAQDFDSADDAPTRVSTAHEIQQHLGPPANGISFGAVNGAYGANGVVSALGTQPGPAPAPVQQPPIAAAPETPKLPRMPTLPPIPQGAPRASAIPAPPGGTHKATLMGLAQVPPDLLTGAQPPGAVVVPPRRQDLDYDDVAETRVSDDHQTPVPPAPQMQGSVPGQRQQATLMGVVAPTPPPGYGVPNTVPQPAWGAPQPTAPQPNAPWPQPPAQPVAPQPPAAQLMAPQPYPQAPAAPQQPQGAYGQPQGYPQGQPQGYPQAQPQGYNQPQYGNPQGYPNAVGAPQSIPGEPPRPSGTPAALWVVAALALIMFPGIGGFAVARYRSHRNAVRDLPTLTVVPPATPTEPPQPTPEHTAEAAPTPTTPPAQIDPTPTTPVPPPVVAQPTPAPTPVQPTPAPAPVVAQPTPAPAPAEAHNAHHTPATAHNTHEPRPAPTPAPVVATNTHPPPAPPVAAPTPAPSGDLNDAIRRRDWTGAARILEGEVHAQPNSAPLHAQLAGMYERAGQPQRALAEYRTAVRLDRRNVGILHRLADTQVSTGDRSGAIQTYRQILTIAPGDPAATARLHTLEGGGH